MNSNYYKRAKLTSIIMDLIYLEQEMRLEGHTDEGTLKELRQTINSLKYYLQFLPKNDNND